MSPNSTFPFGGYSLFGRDSPLDLSASSPLLPRPTHLSYYVAVACVLFVTFLMRAGKGKGSVDAPFYKASKMKWMFDAETLVRDSYNKFYGKVYQIKATEGVQTLIPPRLLSELRGLPEDTLSATEAISEAMMTKYTRFTPGPHAELLNTIIRTKLSHNLARLVPQLKDELDYFVANEFPACEEWTPVKIQPLALRAISRLSGHAFVGRALNRNEAWMDTNTNFAVHVFVAVVKLQFFPAWLRPIGQYLVSDLAQIRRDIAKARGMLQPIIEERLRDLECGGYNGEEKPDDFIQWLLESLPEEQRTDFVAQTELQLILSAASIHTTNNLLVDCLYDLAAYPDVQEELRQEAIEILEDEGGWAKKDGVARLKKMDSFMKEVQRLAGNVTAFIRKVVKPIDLSDGTHLPSGTKLLTPLAGISHDEKYYTQPDTFDALRFWKLRQASPEDANRHQFTTIGDVNMHFGAGKHACPGRFFAANAVKVVLAYYLLSYDIKLKDGEERPKSMMIMMSKTPDPKGEILFRRRGVKA
ncbi:cytochrome P450 [Thozetella sp. PMI_491]|nr:cytochrome P450 [Thozetella sp. PMI_491]